MKKINITIREQYKSIPSGFRWDNVPQFSILTGVNGAGKTQLLEVLQQQERNGMQIAIPFIVTTADGEETNLVVPSQQTKSQNLSGLISYFNDTDRRLNTIRDYKGNLRYWNDRIDQINSRLSQDIDDEERHQLNFEKTSLIENSIKPHQQMLRNSILFSYEEELKSISKICGKPYRDLTEEDIRRYANPYFNDFSEIDDFEKYIRQANEEYKENSAKAVDNRDLERVEWLASQEKPFQTINRLFRKFGFNYYEMMNPFPDLKERNGEIRFKGKQGEIIDYNALSSGEQMIVKFIILSLGRNIAGRRINTLILDEPDAHLHPTMSKMMVEILNELSQPKEAGGGGIRVMITTHSPSTVAFAPEGSLFVIEKDNEHKKIRETSAPEAVNILSDGILTYDKAVKQFSLALNSDKDVIVFVEGKTDILHLNRANELLGYNIPFVVIDMHDAGALASFIKSTPAKFFPGKKLIALFDADGEGYTAYNNIKGDSKTISNAKIITAIQCENQSFAMTLVAPKKLNKYCPIEFLYSYDYLKRHDMLEKRNFQEYQNLYKASTPEESIQLTEEYNNETGLRPFKAKDSNKDSFSQHCLLETDPEIFRNFIPTLEVIKQIMEYK